MAKIIQILAANLGGKRKKSIYGLDDDGGVWIMIDSEWHRFMYDDVSAAVEREIEKRAGMNIRDAIAAGLCPVCGGRLECRESNGKPFCVYCDVRRTEGSSL